MQKHAKMHICSQCFRCFIFVSCVRIFYSKFFECFILFSIVFVYVRLVASFFSKTIRCFGEKMTAWHDNTHVKNMYKCMSFHSFFDILSVFIFFYIFICFYFFCLGMRNVFRLWLIVLGESQSYLFTQSVGSGKNRRSDTEKKL